LSNDLTNILNNHLIFSKWWNKFIIPRELKHFPFFIRKMILKNERKKGEIGRRCDRKREIILNIFFCEKSPFVNRRSLNLQSFLKFRFHLSSSSNSLSKWKVQKILHGWHFSKQQKTNCNYR
jgi:hypothetical protein